jgi:hypothetical protein
MMASDHEPTWHKDVTTARRAQEATRPCLLLEKHSGQSPDSNGDGAHEGDLRKRVRFVRLIA